jgi:hypothetical protein
MTPKEACLKCSNENRRIPELEKLIATDPFYSYRYARNVIKGRFLQGEKVISTYPDYSYYYAVFVLKESFSLCHPIIFNSEYRNKYFSFLKSNNYDLNEIGEWLI